MSTIIRFKRKLSEGNEGIKLLPGEPFFNLNDKHFYIGNDDGSLQNVAGIQINNNAAADTVDFHVGVDHYQKTINNVANVSKTVGGRNIDEIFETNSTVVKEASTVSDVKNLSLSSSKDATIRLTWGDARNPHSTAFTVNAGSISGIISSAKDVTSTINGTNISDIFSSDGKKVKNAASADSATKLATSAGDDLTPVYFNEGKPVKTRYSLDYATDSTPGIIKLGTSKTGNQLSLLKSTSNEGYVDVTQINTNISSNKSAIDTNKQNISLNTNSIMVCNTSISDVKTQVSACETTIKNHTTKINSCETSIDKHNDRITACEKLLTWETF